MNKIDKRFYCYIFLFACLIHLPALFTEFSGDSSVNNLLWSEYFAREIYAGNFYPRWLSKLNAGCGSAVFFYYNPLPFYVASLFEWLPDKHLPLIFSYILVSALAGTAFYAWLRAWFPEKPAALAAGIYLLMPYMWIDMYERDAYTEFFSFLFIPLLLRLATDIIRRNRIAIFVFSLVYTLQILSSLHGTLIGSILIFCYSIYLFVHGKQFRKLPEMALAAILGLAMACFYLLPVTEGFSYVKLGITGLAFNGVFNYDSRFAFSSYVFDTRLLIYILLPLLPLLDVKSIVRKRKAWRDHSFLLFWLGIMLFSIFMMTSLSSFIVNALPIIKKMQFPWRFAIITSIAIPTMAASIFAARKEQTKLIHILSFLFLIMLCGSILVLRFPETSKISHNIESYPNEYLPATAASEWLMADSGAKAYDMCSTKKVIPLSGKTESLDINMWESRHIKISTNVSETAHFLVGQFNFHYWQAFDAAGNPISLDTSPEGLISFTLPPGKHDVVLQLSAWKSERYGAFISIAGLIICISGLLWAIKTNKTERI